MKQLILSEECQSSECVYSGKMLRVYRDQVLLPNKNISSREYIIHPGASVVIPWLDKNTLIMERQYRYSVKQEFLELPAGKLNHNEDPLVAIKRELLEETGYTANRWQLLGRIHPCIGYSNEEMFLYMAWDLTYNKVNWDDDELLEIIEMPFESALDGIKTGLITDAKTIIGLFWAEKWLKNEWTFNKDI